MAAATSKGSKSVLQPYTAKQWKQETRELLEKVPPPTGYTVKFVRVKVLDAIAECTFNQAKKEFTIKVRQDLTYDGMCEALVHETAHVLDWCAVANFMYQQDNHGPTWGVWYAYVYTKFWQTR